MIADDRRPVKPTRAELRAFAEAGMAAVRDCLEWRSLTAGNGGELQSIEAHWRGLCDALDALDAYSEGVTAATRMLRTIADKHFSMGAPCAR